MNDNDIYTFELDFCQTKTGLARTKLGETHKLLKNPSFTELNRMITDYPPSPSTSIPSSRPESHRPRPTSTSRGTFSRSPFTEEERYKECTFKPKISEMPGKENKKLTFAEKISFLARPKKEVIEQREKVRRQKEIQQAISYNYTPSITQYFVKPTIPLEDRFKHEKLRLEERERLRRTQDLEKEAECTFKPQITNRKTVSQLPLFQRVDEVQVEKLKKYTKLRQKYEFDYSFKPDINEKSRNLSQRKVSSVTRTSSHKCLSRTASSKQSLTNETSPFRLPTRESYQPSDFLNRQVLYSARAAEKLKEKMEEKLKGYNFTPVINRTSSIIAENSALPGTVLQKVRKLSEGNLVKMEKQEKAREEFYSQFRYSPEICDKSRRIGRSSSIEKLAENVGKDKLREKRMEEMRKEDQENCTFSPDINLGKFAYVKSSYRQNADILRNIEKNLSDRSVKSREIQYKRDYKELKDCSFRPEIKKVVSRNGSLSAVKGLDRYLELKEIGKRLAKEKYERELKVFCQRPPSSYTSRV